MNLTKIPEALSGDAYWNNRCLCFSETEQGKRKRTLEELLAKAPGEKPELVRSLSYNKDNEPAGEVTIRTIISSYDFKTDQQYKFHVVYEAVKQAQETFKAFKDLKTVTYIIYDDVLMPVVELRRGEIKLDRDFIIRLPVPHPTGEERAFQSLYLILLFRGALQWY